jgi:hypothetical protein
MKHQSLVTKLTVLVMLAAVSIVGMSVSPIGAEKHSDQFDVLLLERKPDHQNIQRPLKRDLTRLFEILGASHHGWSLVDDSRPPERSL